MYSQSPVYAQVHKKQVLKEGCDAGTFQHVAHMNVFEGDTAPLRIPVKLFSVTTFPHNVNHSGYAYEGKRDDCSSAHTDTRMTKDCELVEEVRSDLMLSDSEYLSEDEEKDDITSARSSKNSDFTNAPLGTRGKPFTKGDKIHRSTEIEDLESQRAKDKIIQFLDFPAIASGLAFRTLKELQSYNTRAESETIENRTPPCSDVPIPITRQNAVFLRESQKSLRQLISQQQSCLENYSPKITAKSASFQEANGAPNVQPPVEEDQNSLNHTMHNTNHHSDKTTKHDPQPAPLPIPKPCQNGVFIPEFQKPSTYFIVQKQALHDDDNHKKSAQNGSCHEDDGSLNDQPAGKSMLWNNSNNHSDETAKHELQRAPVPHPRTKHNVSVESKSTF